MDQVAFESATFPARSRQEFVVRRGGALRTLYARHLAAADELLGAVRMGMQRGG